MSDDTHLSIDLEVTSSKNSYADDDEEYDIVNDIEEDEKDQDFCVDKCEFCDIQCGKNDFHLVETITQECVE